MDSGFRLGKLFGIQIKIDWSWLLIFILITWNLAILFGQFHPVWGPGLRWGTALIASILFFASVLAHEFAHSLMAQAQGVKVRSITLFLFGGVSNIQRHPPSPKAEFLITIVGPVTSLVLGLLLTLLAGAGFGAAAVTGRSPTEMFGQLSPLSTLLIWLGSINILLALFNMIPGFPLDGGRVLRSILWAIIDDLRRATRWASWVGQAVAWIFIAMGIAMIFGFQVPFFGTGLVGGIWLAFIGWFLNSASVQSYRQIVVHDILEGVPVKQLMRPKPPIVPPDCVISDLVNTHIMRTDDHAFPVMQDNQLVGMITLEDVRKVSRDEWETVTVGQVMTPMDELTVVGVNEDAADTLMKLTRRDVRQLPVMENGRLAGLLRRRDIVKWLQLQSEAV
ncbi:MAG: site-2 protease family protein [Anaerolineae bacterium]|nr:site-2 protease family protein [Anaerolineae bacterium]